MRNQETTPVGSVEMFFDDNGKTTNAIFHPMIRPRHTCELIKKLGQIRCDDPKQIKSNADEVIAHWFFAVSEIELADREKFDLVGEVRTIEKNRALIEYNLKEKAEVAK
jgi:hypothetical protein